MSPTNFENNLRRNTDNCQTNLAKNSLVNFVAVLYADYDKYHKGKNLKMTLLGNLNLTEK